MYDIIVIGGGHAGCEAALAAAKMDCSTLLITPEISKIATMPCNPAIGGPAKGHLVCEIDALGGAMGKIADQSLIQIRLLNYSKGPAVWAYRAQIEREKYKKSMIKSLKGQKNLDLEENEVTKIFVDTNRQRYKKTKSIITKSGKKIKTKAVIIATGTFLQGEIIIGDQIVRCGGRIDADASLGLSKSLKELGLKLERLQTATPPRVAKNSVDFKKMEIQPGTPGVHSFSSPKREIIKASEQIPCYLTFTNNKTHKIIKDNIHLSPIKSGMVSEHGPRHCPSIDRKVINFPKKSRHPIFVEPEGKKSDRLYLQGLTTAMPERIQQKITNSVAGLEKAKILQPGYAVVYDFVPPWQIYNTLEVKKISGLYLAGQINGTSGYEEAAAQGLVAGINAVLKIKKRKPFILGRNQAYIGVLIDDLVTKEHREPYRMYTSQAEYRLLLRQDNADLRLTKLGCQLGLVSKKQHKGVEQKRELIKEYTEQLKVIFIPFIRHSRSSHRSDSPTIKNISCIEYLNRPNVNWKKLIKKIPQLKKSQFKNLPKDTIEQIEIEAKYDGYLKKQESQVEKVKRLEQKKLPQDINYKKIPGLRNAARERLQEVEPQSLGQAARISGVTPADISILLIWIERLYRTQPQRLKS